MMTTTKHDDDGLQSWIKYSGDDLIIFHLLHVTPFLCLLSFVASANLCVVSQFTGVLNGIVEYVDHLFHGFQGVVDMKAVGVSWVGVLGKLLSTKNK